MAYGDLKVRNLIWNTGSGDNTVVLSTLATTSSPTFTGTVTVPTPAVGDNSTKAASTAFVVASFAPKASPTFTGTVTVPTASANDNTTKAASTAYVQTELGDYLTTATATSTYAPKAAPAFTGTATGVNLTLSGNLTVNGTQTIINTQTLDVEDKQIEIGKVSSPSDSTADQGGIKLKGATDKTFLWVNSTDAWTSSEHVALGDGKKAYFGNGQDLEIYHHNSGTNNYIDSVLATADFYVRPNKDFYIMNVGTGDVHIKCIKDESVELYENNVKRLETTTDGINVIGQVKVNGSALSAAPEVTLTASEAITAEDAIMVKTNGQAEKISGSAEGTGATTTIGGTGGNLTVYDICYDQNANKYVVLVGYGYQGSVRCQVGTPSADGTTISSWGTMTEFTAIGYPDWDERKRNISLVYDSNQQKCYFAYRDKENSGRIRHGWISISGTTPSLYRQNLESGNFTNVDCVSATFGPATNGQNILMVSFISGSTIYCARAYDNGSEATLASRIAFTNQAARFTHMSAGNGGFMTTWTLVNSSNRTFYEFFTCAQTGNPYMPGVYDTLYSNGNQYTNSYAGVKSAYDPNSNRFVCFWASTNTGNMWATIVFANSSSATKYGPFEVTTGNVAQVNEDLDVNFDANSGKIIFTWCDTGIARIRAAKIVNNAFVFDAVVTIENGSNTCIGHLATIDTTKNKAGTLLGKGLRRHTVYTPSATNLDDTRFIGFAKASVSSGAEVTVKVDSNTSTRSETLTPGTKYFVQGDGSLGTSAPSAGTIKAGIALTSNKLLISDR